MTTFDPREPLAPAPSPWAELATPSTRSGPPFHMTEMIAAEPFLAERLLDRLADPESGAGRLAGAIGQAASGGAPVIVTGCGTSEHAAMAAAEILREAIRAAVCRPARRRSCRPRPSSWRRIRRPAASSSGSPTRAARPRRSTRWTQPATPGRASG
jgi:hypothetical protein